MGGGRHGANDGLQVQHLAARHLVVIEHHLPAARLAQGLDALAIGRMLRRAAGVEQLPGRLDLGHALHHAEHGRYTDAAGKEGAVRRGLRQRKVVARRTDGDLVADLDVVVNVARTAAAGRIALYADHVAVRFTLPVHQRVASHHAVAQVQVDVRPRGKCRQRRAVGVAQLETVYAQRLIGDGMKAGFDLLDGTRGIGHRFSLQFENAGHSAGGVQF